jgi:HAD superfamily hydrolase (TIGR01509 family)
MFAKNPSPSAEGQNLPMIRGVALDMDGLMFDTEPLYHRAADDLLRLRGHRYEDAVRRQMMGQPGPKAIQIMIDYYGLTESWSAILEESNRIFAGYLRDNLRPLPGLFNFIDWLEDRQLPFGVATSSSRRFATEILERGGVLSRIGFLLSADDVTHGKPDPEIYLAAADRMDLPPEQVLVLEDSGNGALAGVSAGCQVVAIPGDHSLDHDFSGTVMTAESLFDPKLIQYIEGGWSS